MMGTFCSNYAFYFVFSWLPLYLVHERDLSVGVMTRAASAFYVVDGASVLLTGWLLDRWIRRGASFNRAYKTALALKQRRCRPVLIGSTVTTGLVARRGDTAADGASWTDSTARPTPR
jgi:MFS family permease